MAARVLLFGGATLGDRADGFALPVDRRGVLLAYLVNDGGWVDRDRLAFLFWPDADEQAAKRNLRQLLHRTKRLGLEPPLVTRSDAVRWPVDSDVGQFRRALAVGDHRRATDLYHGPFLDGFALDASAAAGAWLESERDRLHGAFHAAAMREAEALVQRGELDAARSILSDLVRMDAFAEDAVVASMRVAALAGKPEVAATAYRRFAETLQAELDAEPLEATTDMLRAIERGEPLGPTAVPAGPDLDGPASPLREPRLVGRDAERRALLDATTSLVVVAGPPGIGKSRLLRDTFPRAAVCGASEGLEQVPYHPLARLVRSNLDRAAGLGALEEDLARLVPEVAPGISPAPSEADLAKARLTEAIARFVERVGAPLVIDDLQWADAATLETMQYLSASGIRVVGAYRASEASAALRTMLKGYAARGELTRVELHDLGEHDVAELLADLMRRESGPPTFARWLWQRSSGNPMFVLESLKVLFESGALWADGNEWHTDVDELTTDYSELDMPPVVTEVILRRLGHLSEAAQLVLGAVAVTRLGDDVAFLAAATGLTPKDTADALDACARAGFLTHGEFRHDLFRQSLYGGVEEAWKRLLHERAGERCLTHGRPELAAEHLWFAGHAREARRAWSEHVDSLRSRGLLVDALRVGRQALMRLPEGEDACWLRLQLADTLRASDRVDEAARELASVRLPEGAEPALRLLRVHMEVAMRLHLGLVAEADALLRDARALASLVDDEPLLIDDAMFLARVARDQQRTADALRLIQPVAERLRRGKPSIRSMQFLTSLAVLHDDLGESVEALGLHKEAMEVAKALGSRYHQVEAAGNLVVCLQDLGRYREATALGEAMLELGDYDNAPLLRTNLASTYLKAGMVEEALGHYRKLVDRVEPHLRLIALARCVECQAMLSPGTEPEADPSPHPLIDAALDELGTTDYVPAIARVLIATLNHGSEAQRQRLLALQPEFDPGAYPTYLAEELSLALARLDGPPA